MNLSAFLIKFAGRVDRLKKKYPQFANKIDELQKQSPDPKYIPWMTVQLVKGHDIGDILPSVQFFHDNSFKFKQRDINQYKDVKELEDLVKELSGTISKRKEKINISKEEAEKLYEDDTYVLIRPDTKRAVQKYGAGTHWCITMEKATYYEQYSANNVIFYFLINKTLPKEDKSSKIAFAIQRDLDNKIKDVSVFNVQDENISGEINARISSKNNNIFNKIYSIIEKDAAAKPPNMICYAKKGLLTPEQFMYFWNTNLDNVPEEQKEEVKTALKRIAHPKYKPLLINFKTATDFRHILHSFDEDTDPRVIRNTFNIIFNSFTSIEDIVDITFSTIHTKWIPKDIKDKILSVLVDYRWTYTYANFNDVVYEIDNRNLLRKMYDYIETFLYKFEDEKFGFLSALSRNKNTPADVLKNIYKDIKGDMLGDTIYNIVSNPNCPKDIFDKYFNKVIEGDRTHLIDSISANPNLTEEQFNQLVKIREAFLGLVRNLSTPKYILEQIVNYIKHQPNVEITNNFLYVLETLSKNTNITNNIIYFLLSLDNGLINSNIICNKNVSKELKDYIAKKLVENSNEAYILRHIIENKDVSTDIRKAAYDKFYTMFWEDEVGDYEDPMVKKEEPTKPIDFPSSPLPDQYLSVHSDDPEVLNRLSFSTDPAVLRNLKYNQDTPPEALKRINLSPEPIDKDLEPIPKSAFLRLAGRIDRLKSKYPKLSNEIDELSKQLPNPKYIPWATVQLSKGHNMADIIASIKFFDENIFKFKQKDINQYKDAKELEDLVKELGQVSSKRQEKIRVSKEEIEKLFENDNWILIRPDTKKAVQKYGAGTKWCITMNSAAYYEQYSADNVIFYFLISKTLESNDKYSKIAFAVQRDLENNIKSIDIFNSRDDQIDDNVLKNVVGDYDWEQIDYLIKNDAKERPPNMVVYAKYGLLTPEQFMYFWKINTENVPEEEKERIERHLFDIIDEKYEPLIMYFKNTLDDIETVKHYDHALKISTNPKFNIRIFNILFNYIKEGIEPRPVFYTRIAEDLLLDKYIPQNLKDELLWFIIKDKKRLNSEIIPYIEDPEMLRFIFDNYPPIESIIQTLFMNKNTPSDIIEKMYKKKTIRENYELDYYIARNPNTPIYILEDLSKDKDMMYNLARNPNINSKILDKIYYSVIKYDIPTENSVIYDEMRILYNISMNLNSSPQLLEKIYNYVKDSIYYANVEKAIAQNPNTPDTVLKQIEQSDIYGPLHISVNPKISQKHKLQIWNNILKSNKVDLIERLIENKNIPENIKTQAKNRVKDIDPQYFKDNYSSVKPTNLPQQNFPTHPLSDQYLAITTDDPQLLDKLSNSTNPKVIEEVLNNPSTPQYVIEKLKNKKVARLNKLIDSINPLVLKAQINKDISMDMETIKDTAPFFGSGQEVGSYQFVKKPDLPLNVSIYEHQEPYFQVDPPKDFQPANDELQAISLKLKLLIKSKNQDN